MQNLMRSLPHRSLWREKKEPVKKYFMSRNPEKSQNKEDKSGTTDRAEVLMGIRFHSKENKKEATGPKVAQRRRIRRPKYAVHA